MTISANEDRQMTLLALFFCRKMPKRLFGVESDLFGVKLIFNFGFLMFYGKLFVSYNLIKLVD